MVRTAFCASLLCLFLVPPVEADLLTYVGKEDSTYRWSVVATSAEGASLQHAELHMVSQTWRGTAWQHRLLIVRLPEVKEASHALLIIGGGSWREGQEKERLPQDARELKIAYAIATATRMPVAFISHVPFQPLFDGKREDQIIAYTFDQYLKTGDDEWPLLMPMTKAAVRALDTIQAFTQKEWKLDISKFIVTGGSKRGWTTWLTGASDPRVAAIAPMVIDVLNMGAQMKHQREAYGRYSEQIKEYTEYNIQDRMDTEAGRKLVAIVDPFAYRRRLTMPKFILLGTNDPYWTVDALNLYYDELLGEKYILYVPNAGHGLNNDMGRLVGNISAFVLKTAGRLKFPAMKWDLKEQSDSLRLTIQSDLPPTRMTVWRAAADTRDFRESKWQSEALAAGDGPYTYELKRPDHGYAAAFGEALYMIDQHPLYLCTNLRVIGSSPSASR